MKRAYIYTTPHPTKIQRAMTNDYRYRLDNTRPRIKVTCPACGRQKKLVRYVDTQTGRFLADHVGKCDRIFKCGYHYTPSDYFRDHPWLNDISYHRPMCLRINVQHPKPSFVERSQLVESMNRCQTSALFRLYNVGATTRMNDAVIFWQVDVNGGIRTGKIMRYGNDGHRIKEDGLVNFMWAHRLKSMVDNPDDFNLVQCFFGEHLLSVYPDSKVMIVESEKSAIIASHYYPQFLWLASGGCCGCLNQTASQVLKGREVWLVPDLDAEDRWRDKLTMLRAITPTVGIVTAISDMATPEQRAAKLDIVDFLLDAASRNNPVV